MFKHSVIVIGCGVVGLSCGIRFLENGFAVKILARDLPPHTTSNAAAAIWYPYKVYPQSRVIHWGSIAFNKYSQLAKIPESGVSTIPLIELFVRSAPEPWWKDAVKNFRHASTDELPPGYQDGYLIEAPLIDTSIYMNYLLSQFRQLGGIIVQQTISSLSELSKEKCLVVNCAGLGAREIANDLSVYPIRGQIMRVRAADFKYGLIDENSELSLAYIVPRGKDCILGGTAEENNWNLLVEQSTAEDILDKCCRLVPILEEAEVLEHIVGLRPARPEVRLELENLSSGLRVIHNYGHGGAGFTLSWGCAEEVLNLAIG